jgi:tRNA 2-thiouridine synthesizing protein A
MSAGSSIDAAAAALQYDREWDAGDLGCGELVIELRFRLKAMRPGQVIRVHATDTGAVEDLPAWCRMTRDILRHHDPRDKLYYIERGSY